MVMEVEVAGHMTLLVVVAGRMGRHDLASGVLQKKLKERWRNLLIYSFWQRRVAGRNSNLKRSAPLADFKREKETHRGGVCMRFVWRYSLRVFGIPRDVCGGRVAGRHAC